MIFVCRRVPHREPNIVLLYFYCIFCTFVYGVLFLCVNKSAIRLCKHMHELGYFVRSGLFKNVLFLSPASEFVSYIVLLLCNLWRTLAGFSWGCMVIVQKSSF